MRISLRFLNRITLPTVLVGAERVARFTLYSLRIKSCTTNVYLLIRTSFASRTVATFSAGEGFFKSHAGSFRHTTCATFLPEEGLVNEHRSTKRARNACY